MIINTFPLLHLPLSKQYLDIVQSALSFFEREAEEKDIKKRKKKKVINSKLQRPRSPDCHGLSSTVPDLNPTENYQRHFTD